MYSVSANENQLTNVITCVSIQNKRKVVNATANRYYFCVNSVHNLFVDPELMNTTYPEILGTLCAIFLPKISEVQQLFLFPNKLSEIKLLAICTPLIWQLIWNKKTTFYLEKCRRSSSHTSNKGTPLAAARPPISHFNHFNNRKDG